VYLADRVVQGNTPNILHTSTYILPNRLPL
ncbi:unnamed protein product, partial [marine sediment metagenome]